MTFSACEAPDVFYVKMPSDASLAELPHFEEYRKNFRAEKEQPPRFTCRTVAASDVFVPQLPDAKWITVETPVFGSEHAKQGGTLYYHIPEFPPTFRYCGPNTDGLPKKLFWTQMPLLDSSPADYSFMPAAAVAWSFADDGKTVYYKLHEGMLWSDGKPCTADDFVFAVSFFTSKNLVDPAINEEFEGISVKKITDYCIAVTYNDANNLSQSQLLMVTNLRPVCKHFYNGVIPTDWVYKYNDVAEPTTGPYYLSSAKDTEGLIFNKVTDWWGYSYNHYKYLANFDSIIYSVVLGNAEAAFNHFKAGKFDLLELSGTEMFLSTLNEACVTDGYVSLYRTVYEPIVGMHGFFFNCADPMLTDPAVRKALFYAFDIDGVRETVYSPDYTRLTALGAGQGFDGISFNNDNLQPVKYDSAKANELLDKTAFNRWSGQGIRTAADGKHLKLVIAYSHGISRLIIGLLTEQAKKCGVQLEFRRIKQGNLEVLTRGKFQIYFGELSAAQIPNHYYDFHSSFAVTGDLANICALKDPELDKLLETYNRFNLPLPEQAALNQKIEAAVAEDFVFLPYYYTSVKSFVTWKWICFPGWINQRKDGQFTDTLFTYAWFDKDIYDEVIEARSGKNIVPMGVFDLYEN